MKTESLIDFVQNLLRGSEEEERYFVFVQVILQS